MKAWIVFIISLITSFLWAELCSLSFLQENYLDVESLLSYRGGVTIIASISGMLFLHLKANEMAVLYFIGAWVNAFTVLDIWVVYMISDAFFSIMTYMSIAVMVTYGKRV